MGEEFFDTFTGTNYPSYSPSSATRELGNGWELDPSQGYINYNYTTQQTVTAVTYKFSPPIPYPSGGFNITFSNIAIISVSSTNSIVVYVNGIAGKPVPLEFGPNLDVLYSYSGNITGNITSIYFSITSQPGTVNLFSFTSDLHTTICLAPQSKILTLSGYKELQDIQRGEQLPQGRVAKVIETSLSPNSMVEITTLGETLACSNHTFISQGKRVLAKDLGETKRGKAKDLLLPAKDGKYKLLDIQFDFEGSYTVSGLTSQSRSPYCKISPLPKELYWNIENYKEIRVENTLYED